MSAEYTVLEHLAGFEPATQRVRASRSTAELQVRASSPVPLEALALPLSYRGWYEHAPSDRKLVLLASRHTQTFARTILTWTNVTVGGATATVVDALLPSAFVADPR